MWYLKLDCMNITISKSYSKNHQNVIHLINSTNIFWDFKKSSSDLNYLSVYCRTDIEDASDTFLTHLDI